MKWLLVVLPDICVALLTDVVLTELVEAISPLPCRDTLPVLVTMWLSVLSGALILCCTSCVTAASAHSFNADQLWCASHSPFPPIPLYSPHRRSYRCII